ncbi:hypothetical protein LJY25_19520 [Hymenobacter sp. BT175]|nr:hypothetical protein [Hymenobacter translucens]
MKTIFDYVANLENDKSWRKEINSTTMSTRPQINALATENSYLSKRVPNNVLHLSCIAFAPNQEVIYQTVPESEFFLKSIRQVNRTAQNKTALTYSVEFDKAIVKHGLGFPLPSIIIKYAAKSDLSKYLTTLKSILESSRT